MPQAPQIPPAPRPRPLRIADSLGRSQSLASGPDAHVWAARSPASRPCPRLLILGLGPRPAHNDALAALIPPHYKDIAWVECPAFEQALAAVTVPPRPLPPSWRRLSPEEAVRHAPQADILLYRQNQRLFPEFWGPLWGRIQARLLGIAPAARPQSAQLVILYGGPDSLLLRELQQAFSLCGFAVRVLTPQPGERDADPRPWHRLLREERPCLFFSVNGQGLDAGGEIFHLLTACGVAVALWCVDNPWHILSRFRLPWWGQALLCCTDASFLPGLKAAGAQQLLHLPLAVAPHMWEARPCPAEALPGGPLRNILFVGRLAFPHKAAFFGAARLPDCALQEAFALQDAGGRPDFAWWCARLQQQPRDLWPGNAVRAVGLGAEECAQRQRQLWLDAARPCGLTHFGPLPDAPPRPPIPLPPQLASAGKHCEPPRAQILMPARPASEGHTGDPPESPQPDARPPVDYYHRLPALYASAACTLNVTSLLLPQGLTQRHFDVWAAGGFLLTDDSPGLDIFPPELTAPIRIPHPQDLPRYFQELAKHPSHRAQLQKAWKIHLQQAHSYPQRIRTLCQHLKISP